MHDFEDQTGEIPRSERGAATRALRRALLLVGGAIIASMALLAPQAASGAVQQPPMILPSDAGTSASGARSGAERWLVGGLPGGVTHRIATATGAKAVSVRLGSYRIARSRAADLADRLDARGLLVFAEPDVPLTSAGYPPDLRSDEQWWLNRVVSPSDVTPPQVTGTSPMIALVEESLDPRHPDLAQANLTRAKSLGPEADWHGTAVAAIAGSPGEGLGIRGVWPGARMRLFPSGLACSTASKAVTRAANQGAAVINMSYTFPAGSCFTHFQATQYAVRRGSLPVAAAGNSGDSGNAPLRPAVDPHVLSVGAVGATETSPFVEVAGFSTRNSGVDIAAPGARVLAPHVSTGTAGSKDQVVYGWREQSGTSFAAPIVSAAAAWLRQVRPNLGNLQIARLLTSNATDIGAPGRDPEYGEGLLSIEQSLSGTTPLSDPYEPNDDIRWINGSLLRGKSPFLWRVGAGKRRILKATLSRAKDPADVYRVMIPARRRIVVNVAQLEGDIVLSALRPKAKRIYRPGRKNLIVRSNRPYPKTEGIVVRNLKKRRQAIWLAVTPSGRQVGNDMTYRIKVVRR